MDQNINEFITFNVYYDKNGQAQLQLDDNSKQNSLNVDQERANKYGNRLINATNEALTKGTNEILKYAEIKGPIAAAHMAKVNVITLGIDYFRFLTDEHEIYGDIGLESHAVALGQTLAGFAFSSVAGIAGTASTGGNFLVGYGSAVSASIFFDEYSINGKSLKGWIGDAIKYTNLFTISVDETNINGHNNDIILKQTYDIYNKNYNNLFACENLSTNFKFARDYNIAYQDLPKLPEWQAKYNSSIAQQFKNYLGEKLNQVSDTTSSLINKKDINSGLKYFKDAVSVVNPKYIYDKAIDKIYSPQLVEVKKNDTVYSIAKHYNLTVDELLKTPGNEYLSDSARHFTGKGQDLIMIYPSETIHIPASKNYDPKTFKLDSTYEPSINTTNDSFSYLNALNNANYSSPSIFDKNVFKPFTHYSNNKYATKIIDLSLINCGYFSEREFNDKFKYFENLYRPDFYQNKFKPTNFTNSWNQKRAEGTFKLADYIPGTSVHGEYKNKNNWTIIIKKNIKEFPLIIDLKNDGLRLKSIDNSTAFYDINDDGYLENLSWPDKEEAFLAVDINNDGIINQAKEIAFSLWHADAKTDLDGLRLAFDENGDGIIDTNDSKFSMLRVWQDYNENGISEQGEVKNLAEMGIEAIYLNEEIDIKGNNEIEGNTIYKAVRILAPFKDIGALYDVALNASSAGISYQEEYGEIILHYSNDKSMKIYLVENPEGEDANLSKDNYTVALGNIGNDYIIASNNNTVIDGSDGDDILIGGDGNDWIKGGAGSDTLKGGKGHDIVLIDSEDKQENIDGGEDFDIAIVSTCKAVKLDLAHANIEAAYGNSGNDFFTARNSPVAVYIDGGAGNDIIIGSDFNDILIGGSGNDRIYAGDGDDTIFIDADDDLNNINAGNGRDTVYVYGDKGVTIDAKAIKAEIIFGTTGDDVFFNSGSQDVIFAGNAGNDRLIGGDGNDFLDGGPGNDYLEGGRGSDKYLFYKGAGHDVILNKNYIGSEDLVLIEGSIEKKDIYFERSGKDLKIYLKDNEEDSLTILNWYKDLTAEDAEQSISDYKVNFIFVNDIGINGCIALKEMGDTHEFMMEDGGDHLIIVNSGDNNKIAGANGNDIIYGGDNNDEIYGKEGNDIIAGGKGDDKLYGGSGNDTYLFNKGDGRDLVCDFYEGGGTDKILFGEGISYKDLVIQKNIDTLKIGIKEKDVKFDELRDIISILHYDKPQYKIEYLEFDDGTKINLEPLYNIKGSRNWPLHFPVRSNEYRFTYDKELIRIELGRDLHSIYKNINDVYKYDLTNHKDVINEDNPCHSGTDTIHFGEGISYEDLVIKPYGYNDYYLQIGIREHDKEFVDWDHIITIYGWKQSKSKIEYLEFIDGTKINLEPLINSYSNCLNNNASIYSDNYQFVNSSDGIIIEYT